MSGAFEHLILKWLSFLEVPPCSAPYSLAQTAHHFSIYRLRYARKPLRGESDSE